MKTSKRSKTVAKQNRSEPSPLTDDFIFSKNADGHIVINSKILREDVVDVVFYRLRTFVDVDDGKRVFEIIGKTPPGYVESFVGSLKKGIVVRVVG
jgi:hypothetical protein